MRAAAAEPRSAGAAASTAGLRAAAAGFWMRALHASLEHCPWLTRASRPFFLWWAWRTSRYLRGNLLANAAHLIGSDSTPAERTALGKSVLRHFHTFITEFGEGRRHSLEAIRARIAAIEGDEHFRAARAQGRGAVLVTAHLGSFETAIAELRRHEPRVHVVFRRDPFSAFERMRTAQHRRLGVIEAPVDDGIANWVRLRDALRADEVVLLQGDRVMPEQRGTPMPFLDGTIMMPTGPVRLAEAAGAPIVPLFAPRDPDGRVRLVIAPPIDPVPDAGPVDHRHPAQRALAEAIEAAVRRFPDQWLMIHRAWREDRTEVVP